MSKTRRNFSPEFKSQIVVQLLREEHTVNELAAKYQISPAVIGRWKTEFLGKAPMVFQKGPSDADKTIAEQKEQIATLERKVGQLTIESDWMKKNVANSSVPSDRMALVDHDHPEISVKRQCDLLSVNRSSTYRKPKVVLPDERTIEIMHEIDAIHTDLLPKPYGLMSPSSVLALPSKFIAGMQSQSQHSTVKNYSLVPFTTNSGRSHNQYNNMR